MEHVMSHHHLLLHPRWNPGSVQRISEDSLWAPASQQFCLQVLVVSWSRLAVMARLIVSCQSHTGGMLRWLSFVAGPHIACSATSQLHGIPSLVKRNLADTRGCIPYSIGAHCLRALHECSIHVGCHGHRAIIKFTPVWMRACAANFCRRVLVRLVFLLRDRGLLLSTSFCSICFNILMPLGDGFHGDFQHNRSTVDVIHGDLWGYP